MSQNQKSTARSQDNDIDSQRWDVFLFFFFPVLAFSLAYYFQHFIGALPTKLPIFDLMILILATYRMIRLFVYDTITLFIREWLVDGNSFMRSLGHITSCPWCVGIWASFGLLVFYITLPQYFLLIILLAIAGAASFLQVLSRMIGDISTFLKK